MLAKPSAPGLISEPLERTDAPAELHRTLELVERQSRSAGASSKETLYACQSADQRDRSAMARVQEE